MGIDAEIASSLADRQIELFRFDASLGRYAEKQLDDLSKSLRRMIAGYGGTLTSKQAKEAKSEANAQIKRVYGDISQYTDDELDGFADEEALFIAALLSGIIGKKFVAPQIDIKPSIDGVDLGRYWIDSANTTLLQVETAISSGVLNGHDSSDIAVATAGVIAARVNGAKSLNKTAVQSLANRARYEVYRNSRLTKGLIHTSILDSRTSLICLSRSECMWNMDLEPINGTTLPFANPPLHIRCRSFLRPWVGYETEKMSGEEWLKRKSVSEQDKLLGKGRADLWRRDVITWSDLMDQSGRPLTLQQLTNKYH